jgi:hypothetical protein
VSGRQRDLGTRTTSDADDLDEVYKEKI